jgi:glycosyltransferase involved in cell wall biosynthesis
MKIFYWSPFLSQIATISSVLRSAESITNYSIKKHSISIIDSVGEWENYNNLKNIDFIKLYKKSFYNNLPKGGFLKSRFSQLIIFVFSFNKLLKLLNKDQPDFLIAHLITSLPILLSSFISKKTKIILRISGLPRLNIFRKLYWKFFSKKIFKVTCPSYTTYKELIRLNIFKKEQLEILYDPIINIREFKERKFDKIDDFLKDKKFILGIGRITRQKNFSLLINAFHKIQKNFPKLLLVILGEGEDKNKILNLISKKNLSNNIYLLGYKKNVYKYLINAECFILSSLWEDPGFVLFEAALSNTPIISSNCRNGHLDIMDNEKNGFLFDNNNVEDLVDKYNQFKLLNEFEVKKKSISAKKYIKKYTIYNHFNKLSSKLKIV